MAVLFPLGVRLSTWISTAAFVGLAAARRDRLPLLAAVAWMTGFEATFQVASLLFGELPLGLLGPLFFIALGTVTVPWTWRQNIRPHWRLLAAALVLMVVWVATGFHLNGHHHGLFSFHTRIAEFDPTAEFFNEGSKTLWAAAYLLPLLRLRKIARPRTAHAAQAESA